MAVEEHPVEVELKYRLSDEATGERLLNGETLGSLQPMAAPRSSEQEDRYLDTQDGALARAGYSARLRRQRSTTIVTVKSRSAGDGSLQRRIELEGPADRTVPPGGWAPSAARSLILELCGDAPLVELVTVRQLRRKRRFGDGETVVELSVDEVEVISRAHVVQRFVELEVEVMSGPEEPLLALREVLDADPSLAPSATSKLDVALAAVAGERAAGKGRNGDRAASDGVRTSRGARSTGSRGAAVATPDPEAGVARDSADASRAGEPAERNGAAGPEASGTSNPEAPAAPAARIAPDATAPDASPTDASETGASAEPPRLIVGKTPGVTANDILAEAGRKVLRFHLARLMAREAGTRLGADPEELHAMRVATRRMRAAWRVFGDGFNQHETRRYRNRLRDVARKLGAVRDIDVLVIGLEEYRSALPTAERHALEPLLDDWRAQRETGRAVLVRELDSDGYRRFVDLYCSFVQTPGDGVLAVAPTQPHHVRDTAGSRIWLAYEQVLAYGPILRWADVPTLHQLRIAGKWLRYTLEFVGEALGPDAKPLIEKVVAMQDHLGLMNDAEVAAMKARSLLVENSGTLADAQTAAIGTYLSSREHEVARLKRGAAAPWRALASPTFRRSLARAIAMLSASQPRTSID